MLSDKDVIIIKNSSHWAQRTVNLLSSLTAKNGSLYRELLRKEYVIEDTLEECIDHLTVFTDKSLNDASAISKFAGIKSLGDSICFTMEKFVFPAFFPTKQEQMEFVNQRITSGKSIKGDNLKIDLESLDDNFIYDKNILNIKVKLLSEPKPTNPEVLVIYSKIVLKLRELYTMSVLKQGGGGSFEASKIQLMNLYKQYETVKKQTEEAAAVPVPQKSSLNLAPITELNKYKRLNIDLSTINNKNISDKGIVNIKNDLINNPPKTKNAIILTLYYQLCYYIFNCSNNGLLTDEDLNAYKAAVYTTYEKYKKLSNEIEEVGAQSLSIEKDTNNSTTGAGMGAGTAVKNENKNKPKDQTEILEDELSKPKKSKSKGIEPAKPIDATEKDETNTTSTAIAIYNKLTKEAYSPVFTPAKEIVNKTKQYIPFINEQHDIFSVRESCLSALKELLIIIKETTATFKKMFDAKTNGDNATDAYQQMIDAYNQFANNYNDKIEIFVSFYDLLRLKAKNDKMLKSRKELNSRQKGQSYELDDFSGYTWSDMPAFSASKFKRMKLL